MTSKISKMKNLVQESDYLKDEYEPIKLCGSCPDGDVPFDKMMEWLAANEHVVEHMLKVSKEINSI